MNWTQRLRLRSLKALIEIESQGNISRAAEALNITQPALSKWLGELEQDIGLRLFERNAKGIRPTVHGKALIQNAKRIEAQISATAAEMEALREGSSGRVVVGSAGASGRNTVPLALLRLLEISPKSSVRLIEAPISQLISQLKEGSVDIVVGRSSLRDIAEDIRYEVLYAESIRFIARPGHPLSSFRKIGWDDLMRFPWLIPPKDLPIFSLLEDALVRDGRSLPSRFVESETFSLNLSILESSDFIGTASMGVAERFAGFGALEILSFAPFEPSNIAMYWRRESEDRKAVRLMLNSLRSLMPENAQHRHLASGRGSARHNPTVMVEKKPSLDLISDGRHFGAGRNRHEADRAQRIRMELSDCHRVD